eukprot:9477605-Pyramimonas_sp.AAC.1
MARPRCLRAPAPVALVFIWGESNALCHAFVGVHAHTWPPNDSSINSAPVRSHFVAASQPSCSVES